MTERPNILWIVTTQWRAQAAGFAGDPNARTPHLDELAADSINYTQAVTPHPFGPFARAALLTGVPSPANGVRDYFDPLPIGSRTIAHALRDRGYASAFFGKWQLAARDRTASLVGEAHARAHVPPEARGGFETWDGFEGGFLLNDPWFHGARSQTPVQEKGYQSEIVCRHAADYLRRADESRPRFCVVSLEAPHPPYDAPANGIRAPDPAALILPANVPRGGKIETKARQELAGYYAHIEATDRAIGEVLLPATGKNTIVVFTSVHGDMHGAHGHFRKGWPHEESIRVPLLVRPVAATKVAVTGTRSDALVSVVDLPGWAIQWANGDRADAELPPSAAGRARSVSMPSIVELPHQCDRIWQARRTRERKLVLNADGTPWLYFDLSVDPLELNNLVGDEKYSAEIAAAREQILRD